MDSGGGWLRAHLKPPGVLLLRRPGPAEAMGVTVAMFGHTGLGMLICRIEGVVMAYIYPYIGILTHDLPALRKSAVEYFASF